MQKTLFFDVETTGLDYKKHSIIQFAGIMEYDGEEVDRISVKFQPFDEALIDAEALEATSTAIEDLLGYMPHEEGFAIVQGFLDKHCNKFDKTDKMWAGGYKVLFDLEFLEALFRYNGEKYGIGSYFNWRRVDALYILYAMGWCDMIDVENYKLTTACKALNIPLLDAHDALSDIEATRAIIKKLLKK
jgi:DNA polymerase-3 subunit epsilon